MKPSDLEAAQEALSKLLRKYEPEIIHGNLVRAGLFLAGWELLKGDLVETVHDYFLVDAVGIDLVYSPDYEAKVLTLHKNVFEASILWLLQNNGLEPEHADRIRTLRTFRNEVAHELPKFLTRYGNEIDLSRIQEIKDILRVLSRWHGRLTDPDIVGEDLDSGVMSLMDHLVAAAEATYATRG